MIPNDGRHDKHLEHLAAQIRANEAQFQTLKAEQTRLRLEAAGAFVQGNVIAWGQRGGYRYGRVISISIQGNMWVVYNVVALRADGTEGSVFQVRPNNKPVLLAPHHEEGKVYRVEK